MQLDMRREYLNRETWRWIWQRVRAKPHAGDIMRGFERVSGAILAVAWGWQLINATSTFNSSPSFAAMAALPVPEQAWGLLFAVIGLAQLGGLVGEAFALRPARRLRFVGAAAAVVAFGFLAAGFWASNPDGTGWTTYTALSVGNIWAVRHLKVM